jgi:hypothetical protein
MESSFTFQLHKHHMIMRMSQTDSPFRQLAVQDCHHIIHSNKECTNAMVSGRLEGCHSQGKAYYAERNCHYQLEPHEDPGTDTVLITDLGCTAVAT